MKERETAAICEPFSRFQSLIVYLIILKVKVGI